MDRAKTSYVAQKRPFPKPGSTEYEQLKGQAVGFLIRRAEYEQKASDLGIHVSDGQVRSRIEKDKKQFFAGSQIRRVGLDTISAVDIGPWRLGTLQLLAMLVGLAVIILTGLALRFTRLGKEMRALSDNMALAEVTGIDTRRVVRITWAVAGGLAALAGILYAAAIGSISPNFGVTILLSLFAAAILGGIGNAYGALAGGIVIGLSQEWATLFVNPRWKPAVGFAILILTLLVLPRGIFGRKRARA